jgi:DNA-binding YbaB/EbfC family protein
MRRSGGAGAALPGLGGGGAAGGNPMAAAQQMLAKAQEELAQTTVEGTAGGGAVKVAMSGEHRVTGITLQPEVVDPDDLEMLQDLILAAIADAHERVTELQTESFASITGGLNIPGLGG